MRARLILATVIALLLAGCGGSAKPAASARPVIVPGASSPTARGVILRKDISGPAVGELLTSTNGTWSGSPTSFTYVWQRCSSTGTGCVTITGQTANTYTVATADVGHEVASQVTACNGFGCASQQSNISGVAVASGGSSITGASLASCTGSCTNGTTPSGSANLVCGNTTFGCGSATLTSNLLVSPGGGATAENRDYGYYIPTNLKHDGSSDGKPAAIFDFGRQGAGTGGIAAEFADSQLEPVANSGHFIVIVLAQVAGSSNPRHPETDFGGGGPNPSDNPYIRAAVLDATTRFNLDPARRYLVGGSSAANMTRDAICSTSTTPHNSTLFRGVMTMGGGAQTTYHGTTGSCPSGDKITFYLELSGKNSGTADPYLNTDVGTSHTVLGFDGTRQWWSGRLTAGGTFSGGYLGNCANPVHTNTGSGVLSDVYAYTCSDASSDSPFFEAVAVTGGGHMWCGLDDTNATDAGRPSANCTANSNSSGGFSAANFTWNYFAGTTTG